VDLLREWKGAPLRLQRHIFPERKEGIRHLLPAAPTGPGLPQDFPELLKAEGCVGPAPGQERWARQRVLRFWASCRADPRRPIHLSNRDWQCSAPFGGRSAAESRARESEGSHSSLRGLGLRRGRAAAGAGVSAGLRAPLCAHKLRDVCFPGAEWPRTLLTSSAVPPTSSGVH
jgi:hypothetical protein